MTTLVPGQIGKINQTYEMPATLFNMYPINVNENIPGIHPSYFALKSPTLEERMTCLVIGKTLHYIYVDSDRPMMEKITPSDQVAASIIEGLMSAWPLVDASSRPALFFAAGEWNRDTAELEFKDSIKQVLELQNNWLRNILEQGDQFYTRANRDARVITILHREAAQRLGAKREWAFALDPNRICPFCSAPVVFNAVICRECKEIINPSAYNRLKSELGAEAVKEGTTKPVVVTPEIIEEPKPQIPTSTGQHSIQDVVKNMQKEAKKVADNAPVSK
jgi:hypothetical protein